MGGRRGWVPAFARPLHNRHSGPRAGIQGWEFRIEPHVYSAEYGLSSVVMQRSPFARTRKGVREQREGARGRGMGEVGLVVGEGWILHFASLRLE